MTLDSAARWGIPALLLVGIAWIMLRDDSHPEIVKKLAGCYRSADATRAISFRVDPTGWLIATNARTKVSGVQSNYCDGVMPEKKLVFDRYDRSRIQFDSVTPLLICARPTDRLVAIDDINSEYVSFVRIPCAKTS